MNITNDSRQLDVETFNLNKELALLVVYLINSFVTEMQESSTLPNTLNMHEDHYNVVKDFFPYLINGMKYKEGDITLRIILNNDGNQTLAVGFSYYEDNILKFSLSDKWL